MSLLFRLALILILFAGSVLMAPSRGVMAGVSQIEVCSDSGTETLTLDARGMPVGPHVACPDCLLCVAMAPLPETGAALPGRVARPVTHPLPRAVMGAGVLAIHPTARDPPLSA